MAGIGFELKKMFDKKGLLSIMRAYGYAGIVCTGPMLLGMVLLLGIRLLAQSAGATENQLELLNCMITYTLLISLLLTNAFSLVTTRYTADQLYMDENERVLPSFWGGVSIMLVIGSVGYGIFLAFSGIPVGYQFLCMIFFGELVLVWTEINYLTAIKDYKGILVTFAASMAAALLIGYGLIHTNIGIMSGMLMAVCIGYGIMAVWYYVLLVEYFPQGRCSSFHFLSWFDKYPQLFWIGLCQGIGMYGHMLIMWTSPVKKQICGLFVAAPVYDIPALLAFLSILITTINFVTSVEVNFYPKYRNYFSLFNDGGAYMDIEQAEREMKATLVQELTYTFTKQFFATIVFIIAGTMLLPYLPLGLDEDMLGIYRVLCVAYAFYAVGNCLMLIQLYFSDNRGAFMSSSVFMVVSCIGTYALKEKVITYYGVGFLVGATVFALTALALLYRHTKHIMFHVLCSQPIVAKEKRGVFAEIGEYFSKRYENKYHIRYLNEEGEEED